LIEVYEQTGLGAIAVEEVPSEMTRLYGIIQAVPEKNSRWGDKLLRVNDLVEKPEPEKAPSNLGVVGRYVLPPEIFDCLERTKPGANGEIQLTDGLKLLAKEKGLLACICDGKYYDAGDKLGFLKANVEMALENQELGAAFRAYLKSLKL
jgi:UTP--glucose-1-phosphate uridylyltransferase